MFFVSFLALFFVTWGLVYVTLPAVKHAVTSVARVVARNAGVAKLVERHGDRLRDYWPVVATLVAGAALTAWAGDGFLDLAELVHAKSALLQQTDVRLHDWAVSNRGAEATLFFVTMSQIGGPPGLAVIAGIVTTILLLKRRFRWAIYLVLTACGGGLLDWELKRWFARARPAATQMLRLAQGYSFPSGHAMDSTVVFGALAYLAARAIPRWRWKAAVIALAFVLIAAVAASRVYLGVHWTSDILAGITAGAVWVTTTTVAYEVLRRIRLLRALRIAAAGAGPES